MIKITDKFYIDVTDQYTVQEKDIVKTGKTAGEEKWKNQTYHRTMSEALTNVLQRVQKDKLNTEETITLKEAIKTIKEIHNEFINNIEQNEVAQ